MNMKTYTFEVLASISIDADSAQGARNALYRSLSAEDMDVPYGRGMVYVPSDEILTAELVDEHE